MVIMTKFLNIFLLISAIACALAFGFNAVRAIAHTDIFCGFLFAVLTALCGAWGVCSWQEFRAKQ